MAITKYKTVIASVAILTSFTLSCAHTKSAVEQLISNNQNVDKKDKADKTSQTKRITGREEIKLEKTENIPNMPNAEIELPHGEEAGKESSGFIVEDETQKGQTINEKQDSYSKAITEMTLKYKKSDRTNAIKDSANVKSILLSPEYKGGSDARLNAGQESQNISEPPLPRQIQQEEDVSLNFEDTDIKDIINTFCDLLKIDYILDPGISGKITLQTFNKIKVKDLFSILEKILVLNNLTVVKTGDFYRFMAIEPAKKESLNVFFGKDSALVPPRDRLIIQIIPLEHISTNSLKSIIAPLLSSHASFLDVPDTNNLIIIDTANNIKRLLDIIKIIDVGMAGNQRVELFPVRYSDAAEIAADMKTVFDSLGYASQGPSKTNQRKGSKPGSGKNPFNVKPRATKNTSSSAKAGQVAISFIPIEKINSLLIINPFPELSEEIKFWVSKLDSPTKVFVGREITPAHTQLSKVQIIQIIPLIYVAVESIEEIIKPLLTQQGKLLTVPGKNNLVIADFAGVISQVMEIVSILDVKTLENLQIKLFPLQFSLVEELQETLAEIFSSLGSNTGKEDFSVIKFVPLEKLNSLLVISRSEELINDIEFWISKLDKPSMEGVDERTYIYYVQNAKAPALASLLSQIYKTKELENEKGKRLTGKRKTKKTKKSAPRINPFLGKKQKSKAAKSKSSSISIKGGGSANVVSEVTILADEFTNSLIIRTLPRDYPAILDTIKLLDLMPMQVLIEVLIMELTMDDQTRAGIDWAFRSFRKSGNFAAGSLPTLQTTDNFKNSVSATSLLTKGFSFVAQSDDIFSMFQAFAEDSKINVLSNPILVTSENMPASINITNDVPIETSTITTPTAGQPLTQTTIQYKSVGIKLDILPQINSERFVNLKISQETSDVNESAAFTQPAFFTRSTNTNVVIKDNQTLVIGGLMQTNKSRSETGVPLLKELPVIGRLFKTQSERVRKTELIIFITPHVISNVSEANKVTKDFRSKYSLKKKFKLQKVF